jgi:zinc transport system permease protein
MAITIVMNIRMAGVVLVISLLTVPPNIAMIFTKRYSRIIIWSVITAFAGTAAGYYVSFVAGIPPGATIIFALVLLWIICKLLFMALQKLK